MEIGKGSAHPRIKRRVSRVFLNLLRSRVARSHQCEQSPASLLAFLDP